MQFCLVENTDSPMESILQLLWVMLIAYPPVQVLYVPGSQFHCCFSAMPEDVGIDSQFFLRGVFSEFCGGSLLCWQVGHEHLQLSEPITGNVVFRCSEDFQREKPLGKPS